MSRPDFQSWRLRNEFCRESNLDLSNFSHKMHDGLWNWKFAKLSIAFLFLELKIAMFVIQVFWYWSENCPFQTGKGLQRLRMLRTAMIPNFVWGLKCLLISLFSYSILISTSISILFYSVLFYSILFYSILFYSILFYSILFYFI